jgi:2'-5' RNA ligase
MPPTVTRRQLTLFVPFESAEPIEAVRRVVDPVQFGLIPAHVTLCREDEIEDLSLADLGLRCASEPPLTLRFGRPSGFSGHGILWCCVEGESEYQDLRGRILGRSDLRASQPHITLAHPRNPQAPGYSLAAAELLSVGMSITFDAVRLIEQESGGPWRVLAVFPLDGTLRGNAPRRDVTA